MDVNRLKELVIRHELYHPLKSPPPEDKDARIMELWADMDYLLHAIGEREYLAYKEEQSRNEDPA